jgi:hypothetical protein
MVNSTPEGPLFPAPQTEMAGSSDRLLPLAFPASARRAGNRAAIIGEKQVNSLKLTDCFEPQP